LLNNRRDYIYKKENSCCYRWSYRNWFSYYRMFFKEWVASNDFIT